MKIIYIANARIPTEKAHGAAIMKMCDSFAGQNMELTLLLPMRRNSINEDPLLYYDIKSKFLLKKLFTLDLVKFGKIGFLLQTITFSVSATWYVYKNKPDYVYSRDYIVLSIVKLLLPKTRIFWEAHTAHNNYIVRFVLRKTEGLVAISKGLLMYYLSIHELDRHIIAPSGYDSGLFNKSLDHGLDIRRDMEISSSTFIVGYIGKYKTMGKSKGVEDLIEVFSFFKKKYSDSVFLFVGINREEKKEVIDLAISFGLKRNDLILKEQVVQKEVIHYIKACDILVANYPNTEHYRKYMSPLKIIEFIATGASVIVSDLKSIREVVGNDEVVFCDPVSKNDLLETLINVKEKNIKFVENNNVLNFSWKNRSKKIIDFMSS